MQLTREKRGLHLNRIETRDHDVHITFCCTDMRNHGRNGSDCLRLTYFKLILENLQLVTQLRFLYVCGSIILKIIKIKILRSSLASQVTHASVMEKIAINKHFL